MPSMPVREFPANCNLEEDSGTWITPDGCAPWSQKVCKTACKKTELTTPLYDNRTPGSATFHYTDIISLEECNPSKCFDMQQGFNYEAFICMQSNLPGYNQIDVVMQSSPDGSNWQDVQKIHRAAIGPWNETVHMPYFTELRCNTLGPEECTRRFMRIRLNSYQQNFDYSAVLRITSEGFIMPVCGT